MASAQDIRNRLSTTYPDAKPSTLANWAGQIDAFRFRIKIGDLVALRRQFFGRIAGTTRTSREPRDALRHQRSFEWIGYAVARNDVDLDLLYSLN